MLVWFVFLFIAVRLITTEKEESIGGFTRKSRQHDELTPISSNTQITSSFYFQWFDHLIPPPPTPFDLINVKKVLLDQFIQVGARKQRQGKERRFFVRVRVPVHGVVARTRGRIG